MRRVTRRRAEAVYAPLRSILAEIERTGCVDSVGGKPIRELNDGWYEIPDLIAGLVDWLEIASSRHGWSFSTKPLEVLALRLAAGVPLTLGDISSARSCMDEAVKRSMALSIDEADDIVKTVKIRNRIWEQR